MIVPIEKNVKKAIVILGPPGSGKGTQANLLAEKFNLYHFETSKILEQWFNNTTEDSTITINGEVFTKENEKELWGKGILLSPPLVGYLVAKKVRQLHEQDWSVILSGSPRTVDEAKQVVPLLVELYGQENVNLIALTLNEDESIHRNSHRRICELMRHPVLYNEETEHLTKCPLDGSVLVLRKKLDDIETIRIRLREFETRTVPVIELFEQAGIPANCVDGNKPVADVFQDILSAFSTNNDSDQNER